MSLSYTSLNRLPSFIRMAFCVMLGVACSVVGSVRAESPKQLPVFNSPPTMEQLIQLAKQQEAAEQANKKTEQAKQVEQKPQQKLAEQKQTVQKPAVNPSATQSSPSQKSFDKPATQPQVVKKPILADPKAAINDKILADQKPIDKKDWDKKNDAKKTLDGKPINDKDEKAAEKKPELTNKLETEIVALTNMHRAQSGLPPFKVDPNLMSTARAQANWMASNNSMTHGNYNVAENIAMGQSSPTDALNTWMNSSGHRAHILGGYTTIGVAAYASSNGTIFWCQQFR